MKYNITKENLENAKADVTIVLVVNKNLDHKWVKHREILSTLGFKAENEEALLLAGERYVYVGVNSAEADEIRVAVSKAYKLLKRTGYESAKIALYVDKCATHAASAIVEGLELGSYEFTRYKSKKENVKLQEILISTESYDGSQIEQEKISLGINNALAIATAANYAKEIVNSAPYDYTPIQMAEDALKLAEQLDDVTCEVFDEKFLLSQGMGAFLAVNRASEHPPRLIHLTYKPKNAQKRIVFVGKGLTYDSGGLSLKTGDYMLTMKADKSGGAAAMGIIKGLAELKLPLEVHAIIGATENMIGGNAYKPDDVLVAKNGKTIEVRNTDAEGRLVLADCLCYAQELKPDLLIDMATLTGACVVALGEYTIGIMGHNDDLKHELYRAARKSGELVNALSFNKHLKPLLKSNVADISNVSASRYGGAITAALFLDNFIQDEYKDKWLHLDIAGPAYLEKEWGYNGFGATGAGVRLNLYWLREIAKKEQK
ncbi:MAG: leucyl aminopeptidase [Campylobacteraceae bacterium]|jgi:leucyl aminopeptidase|nr:leucyl aminopeptidase [Campylobacteraceae bacterium]